MTTMLDAALDLAGKGWRVLPCHERDRGERAPAKSPIAALVPHGFHDATTDTTTVREWWTRCPAAMIGAVVPDPLLVLDIDPRNGGSLDDLEDVTGPLPKTVTCWSGRDDGGRHLYYRRPAGRLSSNRLPAGVDLKVSGYCIVAPSLHPATGQPYRWAGGEVATLPAEGQAALAPRVTLRVVRGPSAAALPGPAAALVQAVQNAPEGNRHKMLLWAGCRVYEEGQPDPETVLDELAATGLATGLSPAEVAAAIDWCRLHGTGEVSA